MPDYWLTELAHVLREARTWDQVQAVIDRLEDHYDVFSGPGLDIVEGLLQEAKRRLQQFS
jgi:hypothetical protein